MSDIMATHQTAKISTVSLISKVERVLGQVLADISYSWLPRGKARTSCYCSEYHRKSSELATNCTARLHMLAVHSQKSHAGATFQIWKVGVGLRMIEILRWPKYEGNKLTAVHE